MGHLSNRHFIIGLSGGIAAYKGAELVRLLKKQGAKVRVIMTRGAQEFITPLTLQALSGEPVHTELLDASAEAGMGHIELARWADAVLIAPATADVIARLASGRADDLLTTVALATPAPLFVAPAMNQQMWRNPATCHNIEQLQALGVTVLGPAQGEQACGDVGAGRLLEPETLVAALQQHFNNGALAGQRVVITAGPTREAIDPVRYLTNHSSGKMGFAIARAAHAAGADTVLITGPVNLDTPEGVERINVSSAVDMLAATETALTTKTDLFIASAAVADYRPASIAMQKMKKSAESLQLELVRNPDIVATVAASSNRPKYVVGFAAETQNLAQYAEGKRRNKGLDMICANDVARSDIGFNSDQNALLLYEASGVTELARASKLVIAEQLIAIIASRLQPLCDHDTNNEGVSP
jgi:phosphopantothenoylcysteine decarboxylase/phosphopantothenate--cysteine ligase